MIAALLLAFHFFFLPPSDFLAQGDEEFKKANYSSAVSLYETELRDSPNNSEALWRLSRAQICIGDATVKEKRHEFYWKAKWYADESVKANDNSSDGHVWKAVALGYIAMEEGAKAKVKACTEIKNELDRAITLNPKNAVAYSILGTFYRSLGNVSWIERSLANMLLGGLPKGGYPEAEQVLKKAIDLAPTIMRHQFELGLVYKDWDKPEEAKKIFSKAIILPQTLASDAERIDKMKRFLER